MEAAGKRTTVPVILPNPEHASKSKFKEDDEVKLMNAIRSNKILWKQSKGLNNSAPSDNHNYTLAWISVAARCGKSVDICRQEFTAIKAKIQYRIGKFAKELNGADGNGIIRTWEEIAKIARDVPVHKQTWPLWYSIEWFIKEYHESQLSAKGYDLSRPEQENDSTVLSTLLTPETAEDTSIPTASGSRSSSTLFNTSKIQKPKNIGNTIQSGPLKKNTPPSNFHVSSGATTDFNKFQMQTMMDVKREKEDEEYNEITYRYTENGPPLLGDENETRYTEFGPPLLGDVIETRYTENGPPLLEDENETRYTENGPPLLGDVIETRYTENGPPLLGDENETDSPNDSNYSRRDDEQHGDGDEGRFSQPNSARSDDDQLSEDAVIRRKYQHDFEAMFIQNLGAAPSWITELFLRDILAEVDETMKQFCNMIHSRGRGSTVSDV